ncbi:MAG: 3-phenylpropionate/cinnamic acid dioxygenase subunit beta [Nevskiaceae bacterium]|nr:MAG: 3-phenylpropionate/cinnamic acid dioxygenase subunit beta [Nevskiaceae bacterium]
MNVLNDAEAAIKHVARPVRDASYYELKREIEEHLFDEAEMLDQRRFRDWLETLSDDLVYFMPMTYNVKHGEHEMQEKTKFETDMSWFNEGKWTLTKRVEQILTGVHWAEEPLSRLCRLVTNIQIAGIETNDRGQQFVSVRSRFLTYQNRCEYEEYYFAGKRDDVFRREGATWKLVRRQIDLGQTVLLAKNLTIFF